jgi:hypothetical protein
MIVLGVILAISAYSLYYVARHLGVPRIFAIGMSTAFDGTAMILAQQSLKRAEAGMSSAAPKLWMYLFAGLSSWLNSLHAVLGHETLLAVPLWAGLPVGAVVVFDINTSYARRKALVNAGRQYPAPLPKFGFSTWVFFTKESWHGMGKIIERRLEAVIKHALARADAQAVAPAPSRSRSVVIARPEPEARPEVTDPAVSQDVAESEPSRMAPDRAPVAEPVLHLVAKFCEYDQCGKPIVGGRRDRRFCDARCRVAANTAGKRAQGE